MAWAAAMRARLARMIGDWRPETGEGEKGRRGEGEKGRAETGEGEKGRRGEGETGERRRGEGEKGRPESGEFSSSEYPVSDL